MDRLTISNQSITDVFIMDFMYDRYGNSQTLYEFLPSMRKLDLSGNKIETFQVEADISNKSIKTIYLTNNRLQTVPLAIPKFKELKKLELSVNQIEVVETQLFSSFSGLSVNLSHNSDLIMRSVMNSRVLSHRYGRNAFMLDEICVVMG